MPSSFVALDLLKSRRVAKPEAAAEACRTLVEAYANNPVDVDWTDVQWALRFALEALDLPEDFHEHCAAMWGQKSHSAG